MKILEAPQGSKAWLESRKGLLTGTRAKAVMSKTNGQLVYELVAEHLATQDEAQYTTEAMQNGTNLEDEARQVYEVETMQTVECVGLCVHDEYNRIAVSPDGLINSSGALEIKCPGNKKHAEYLIKQKLPAEYKWQVMQYFVVCEEVEWVDFVSYNPNFPEHKLTINRVHRSEYENDIRTLLTKEVELLEKADKEIIRLTF